MVSQHWDTVWGTRDPEEVTWFQARPAVSLRLIRQVADRGAGILDVGGGASRLVDHLLADGFSDVTVLDIAETALRAARERLGAAAGRVHWIAADVREATFGRTFDVWHDRATFHFLVDADDRDRYLAVLRSALAADGHVVLATFGARGPERCSGLPVRRYDVALMAETIGEDFELVDAEIEQHVAPSGATQEFQYCVFRWVDQPDLSERVIRSTSGREE